MALDNRFWCVPSVAERIIECFRTEIVNGLTTFEQIVEVVDDDWVTIFTNAKLNEVRVDSGAAGAWALLAPMHPLTLPSPRVPDHLRHQEHQHLRPKSWTF